MDRTEESCREAIRIADDAWAELRQCLFVARELGGQIEGLPDISEEAVKRRSAVGAGLLERLHALDLNALPHDVQLTVEVARYRASVWAREADWYWLVFDPLGAGFFALFAPTAYAGGFTLNLSAQALGDIDLGNEQYHDRYLVLLREYARLIEQMRARTSGQAERGTYIPRAQLAESVALTKKYRDSAMSALTIRSRAPPVALSLAIAVDELVRGKIVPAFDALIATLESAGYVNAAPEGVGIAQYPGGREIYEELVRLHTTLSLSTEEVHEIGLARMGWVRDAMSRLFESIGFSGSAKEYLARLEKESRWRAEGAEAVAAFFRRYIDRIAPHIDASFNFKPKAPHDIAPLPDALTGSMTFGYYSPPTPKQQSGLYMFNAANLSRSALPNIAALNYHELVPGHHFHVGSQRENNLLHPLRQHSFVNAYNEGWAEYAASYAGEIGMYEEPEEQFGRLMMESFLTCRLVVDTGMNALGWSLQRAREYMREQSFMAEVEICSETLRYSCDIPAQSLAYKLGDEFIMGLRSNMREQLGASFDIRDFHDAVLKPGALPLPMLQEHVQYEARRLQSA